MKISIKKLEIDIPAAELATLPRETVLFILEQTKKSIEEEAAKSTARAETHKLPERPEPASTPEPKKQPKTEAAKTRGPRSRI